MPMPAHCVPSASARAQPAPVLLQSSLLSHQSQSADHETHPFRRCRADQILRFRKELAFLVTTGRHADTALWYQRLAAASAHTEHAADSSSGSGGSSGSSTSSGGNASGEASTQGAPAPAPPSPTPAFGLSSGGRGGDAAAGFLAAVLEGSSNSSRLDAKLAVSHSAHACL